MTPTLEAPDMVVPAEHPELARISWNRDPSRPIPGHEALALYEANWRHVDAAALTTAERGLIDSLAVRHGRGHFLATR